MRISTCLRSLRCMDRTDGRLWSQPRATLGRSFGAYWPRGRRGGRLCATAIDASGRMASPPQLRIPLGIQRPQELITVRRQGLPVPLPVRRVFLYRRAVSAVVVGTRRLLRVAVPMRAHHLEEHLDVQLAAPLAKRVHIGDGFFARHEAGVDQLLYADFAASVRVQELEDLDEVEALLVSHNVRRGDDRHF